MAIESRRRIPLAIFLYGQFKHLTQITLRPNRLFLSNWQHAYSLLKYCILVSEDLRFPLQTVKPLMKYSIMLHFIRIFTVCKSTRLGVF